ncbi:MarR family winged helix-turn-helix transcriptional regulator [Micromonospora sp. WMMD998]|uniref:MarR family winged helix-turn-helix transcriptional regulator n=1 Tax=Micromonospora sp. WMMD998 TaxID=3016092 RepID=UPI00249CD6FA|nr:MarR family winged helix-turn-helix transcriptional regulator [Micromonospora sp. WMMD998]WFE41652.1 MarR family winged helix-turn-helix transcriptional regulator [Micromonospora sp. WMMD998]
MAPPTVPADGERAGRAGLAGDIVRRLLHVAAAMRHLQDEGIAALGLTPAAGRALYELDPDHPLPARELAEQLGCDRSNVTGLADRLEQAGLVRRRTDPTDRRQKALVVTARGRQVREQVGRVMSDSRLLDGLSADELTTLRELVWKVSDGGCPAECGES